MDSTSRPPVEEDAVLTDLDFKKGGELMPAVVQEAETGIVLMVAWVNQEALTKTLESGYAHYYSRSRKSLWKKGETSGNLQEIEEILVDCDGDTLLYRVRQQGPACHTGKKSCFFRDLKGSADKQ